MSLDKTGLVSCMIGIYFTSFMAKKKTKIKKVKRSYKEKTYFGHSFFFIVVLGGGFVLITLILFLQRNPNILFRTNQSSITNLESNGDAKLMPGSTVVISNSTFYPGNATAQVGDTVTWENRDDVSYKIVADDGSFATEEIAPGATGIVTFSKTGVFEYHSSTSPDVTGTITVE